MNWITEVAMESKLRVWLGLVGVAALLLIGSVEGRGLSPQRKPAPSGKLSGTVLGPDGKPAAKARVMAQTSDGRAPRTTLTDAQGRFQLKCPEGPVDVRARAGDNWSDWVRNVRIRANDTTSITVHISDQPPHDDEKSGAVPPSPH